MEQATASSGTLAMLTLTLSRMSLGETAQVTYSTPDRLSTQTGEILLFEKRKVMK